MYKKKFTRGWSFKSEGLFRDYMWKSTVSSPAAPPPFFSQGKGGELERTTVKGSHVAPGIWGTQVPVFVLTNIKAKGWRAWLVVAGKERVLWREWAVLLPLLWVHSKWVLRKGARPEVSWEEACSRGLPRGLRWYQQEEAGRPVEIRC